MSLSIGMSSTKNMSKVESVGIQENGNFVARFSGAPVETPELTIKDRMVQIAVSNSYVWPKIEKKASISGSFDTTVMAYQFNKDVVRIRAMLPFSLEGKEDQISLTVRDGQVELSLPKAPIQKTVQKAEKKASPSDYDESYLEQLVKTKSSEQNESELMADFDQAEVQEVVKASEQTDRDEVSVEMSAQEKGSTNSSPAFSIGSYVGKFVAFLALVLLIFYALVWLMKRGVFKKSKLGFLNSTKMVEVLNTTYLGPKRSLLMVKAHNQVFLVGSSEAGINLISEVGDVTGLLKDGEKKLAGSNFDTTLGQADEGQKEFKLKEVRAQEETKGPTHDSLSELLSAKESPKDSVKFSEQIKDKVKSLKSLQ
jgi:flagellar biosynthetic protein FliO